MMVLGESGSGGQAGAAGSAGAGNSGGVNTSQGTAGSGASNAGAGAAPGASSSGSGASNAGSWRDSLPQDIRDNPALSSFTDVGNLAKSYINAQGMIGKKGVFVPGEKASEEDWKNFYKNLGQPEFDKFEVKLPDGFEADPEFVGKFKELAHKSGLLPKQAQALVDWQIEREKTSVGAQERAMEAEYAEGLNDLKQEWGETYNQKLTRANAALDIAEKVPGLEGIKEYLQDTKLGMEPAVIKLMDWAASLMGEGKLVGTGAGKFGQTPGEMRDELDKIRNDLKSPLYDKRHADHDRMNEKVADLWRKIASAEAG